MSDVEDGATLGRRAVRGASVTVMGQGVRVLVQLVGTVVLARLLAPSDFGLLAVMLSLVALGELVRDFGLSIAAARFDNLSQAQKSNLFWINVVVGVILAAAVFVLAPVIARVFGAQQLADICRWMSAYYILSGAAAQFRTEINRRLRFVSLAVVETSGPVVGLAAAVLAAWWLGDYRALVIQQMVTVTVGLLTAVVLARWWPGLPSRRAGIAPIVRDGMSLFGTQMVAFIPRNIDTVALGILTTPAQLGLYSRAYQLLMLPLSQLAAPLTRVAVPVLSRVHREPQRYLSFVQDAQALSGIFLVSFYALLIGAAEPAVLLVFGEQWRSMVPIFQVLAIGGIFRGFSQLTFWIFLSSSQSGRQFRFNLWSQQIVAGAILVGAFFGPLGAAWGHSLGYVVYWFLSVIWCSTRQPDLRRRLLGGGTASIVAIALPLAAIAWGATMVLDDGILQIAVAVTCALTYLVAASMWIPQVRAQAQPVRRLIRRRSSSVR